MAGDDHVHGRVEPVEDRQKLALDRAAALVVIAELGIDALVDDDDDRVGALGLQLRDQRVHRLRLVAEG